MRKTDIYGEKKTEITPSIWSLDDILCRNSYSNVARKGKNCLPFLPWLISLAFVVAVVVVVALFILVCVCGFCLFVCFSSRLNSLFLGLSSGCLKPVVSAALIG